VKPNAKIQPTALQLMVSLGGINFVKKFGAIKISFVMVMFVSRYCSIEPWLVGSKAPIHIVT
jgi:hypothetical protein